MGRTFSLIVTGFVCLALIALPSVWSAALAPAKAEQKADYRMVAVSTGKGWACLRFKPDTGETWSKNDKIWQEVHDSAKLASGDYEVLAVGLEGANTYEAIRLERISGRAWYLAIDTWIEVKEAK